jgi:hypothetical protein
MARNTPKGRANAARFRAERQARTAARRRAWGSHPAPPPKANQPPPGPHTPEAVTRCLVQAFKDAGRGPVHLPQVYALLLIGWIQNYQTRLTDVLDEISRWTIEDGDPRERWAQVLSTVFDPQRLEQPIELPELPAPPPAPRLERDLTYHLEAFADSLDDDDHL